MMYGTHTERELAEARRRADDLQYDLDREREARERREADDERARRQRQQEARERYQQAQCEAATWPEAFNKQLFRLRQELDECRRDNERWKNEEDWTPQDTGFWERLIAATERAAALYAEKQAEIERLQRALLEQVADQLDAEFDGNIVSESLRSGDPSVLLYW